tara:strand:- start:689 stop:1684 length:996 start_codon:yes stop_codon:yes gene_type:complete
MFYIFSTGDTAGSHAAPSKVIGGDNFALSTDIVKLIEGDDSTQTIFNVKNYMPTWLVEEHDNGDTLLIKFLQYYYDWLYSTKDSGLYVDNLFDLFDISNIKDETNNSFIRSFIPQLDIEGFSISNEQLKVLLKNIKTDVFQKKGTQAGLSLFFTRAFPEIISVSVKSTGPLENNIFLYVDDTNFTSPGVYETAYKELMHPVGISASVQVIHVFGSGLNDEEDDLVFEEQLRSSKVEGVTLTGFDSPRIGNYFVYKMQDSGSLPPFSGCSGTTHARGITSGTTFNVSNMPTFNHPNWHLGRSGGTKFNDINISGFIIMPLTNNPNTGITGCA